MAYTLDDLDALSSAEFDTIIDVRSPAEFAEDHVPGAINLPVLSNDQRAEVGTIYVQDSAFNAKKIGAAHVARNAADHLAGPLADKDGSWQPLIYCWRGGQRSNSFASMLSQVGWRTNVLEGGYQGYRRKVVEIAHDSPWPAPVILLDGNTGTAKTDLLGVLAKKGVQTLDLEGMAAHRGSLFGAVEAPQPSQKAFETRVAMATVGLDRARPVIVEAESSKIGERQIPPSLWKAMLAAPRIVIEAPLAARARYLTRAYSDLISGASSPINQLDALVPYHGHDVISQWKELATTGQYEALASDLMDRHYDPRYAKSRAKKPVTELARLSLAGLDVVDLDKAATEITGVVAGFTPASD
jgi:tRNA 2-selenouridine synthase